MSTTLLLAVLASQIGVGGGFSDANAATASALAANGSNCSAGSYPLGVSAAGAAESCTAANTTDPMVPADGTLNVTGALTATSTGTFSHVASTTAAITTVTGALTGNASTSTALAANGANCAAGSYPLGVDASGAAESCVAVNTTDPLVPADGTLNITGAVTATTTGTFAHVDATTSAFSKITLNDAGVLPTCDAAARGLFFGDQGANGTADSYTLCAKNSASDTYAHLPLVGRAYGEMYQDPGASAPNAVALTGPGTYDVVDGFSTGVVSGVTFASDTLTVAAGFGGLWLVQYTLTIQPDGAADVMETVVLRNDAAQTKCKAAMELINADRGGNLGGQCILPLADGDTIKLGLENESATDDAKVHHANVTMTRL
jgi:hypothetical protein